MKRKKIVSLLLTGAMTAALLAVPAPAVETPPIRVNSYKGNTLEVGERSGLIIGPGGTEYTVTSSALDTVAVEQVLTFWVAVAKAEGTTDASGEIKLHEKGKKLYPGEYTVTEVEPAPGFQMKEPTTQKVIIHGGESKTLTFLVLIKKMQTGKLGSSIAGRCKGNRLPDNKLKSVKEVNFRFPQNILHFRP